VVKLVAYIARRELGRRWSSSQNLWRRVQLFEAVLQLAKLSTPLRVLIRTRHMIILGQRKRLEEQAFWLRLAAQ
jgi:hypothetical protein